MKKTVVCLLVLFLFSCRAKPVENMDENPLAGWEQIVHRQQNLIDGTDSFELYYPTNVFVAKKLENGILLESKYHLDYNPSGIKGHESKWPFSILIQFVNETESEMKKESRDCFKKNFPDGIVGGIDWRHQAHIESCFFQYQSADGGSGFVIRSGVEEIRKTTYFLPKEGFAGMKIEVKQFEPTTSPSKNEKITREQQNLLISMVLATLVRNFGIA